MKNCKNCGIGILTEEHGLIKCFKYNTMNEPDESKESCLYFIETVYEDEEPLPPLQHLLLKEEELKARKMKGVI